MNVRSFSITDVQQFQVQLQKELDSGFNPTLAICFSDAEIDFRSLSSYLSNNNIDTIGATTCGEIHNALSKENSCSILLMDITSDAYHIETATFIEGEEIASQKIAEVAIAKYSNPAIITYASKVGANGDGIVRGYKKILPPQTPIFGALAGDNSKNEEFTIFTNDQIETNGLVALILDGDKIKVEGKAFSGWKALGKTHIVTKVEGNILYTIDDIPALDLFIDYFGLENPEETDDKAMQVASVIYALKVIDENDLDYLRSPLYYNKEDRSLILGGEVKKGDKIKFCPMPDIDTVSDTVTFFEEYSKSIPKVDTVIINSCIARKIAFGPLMNKEIKDIYKIWNVPTVGIMAMGEIGSHAREDNCNFHNVTCSLVSITEIL